MLTSEELCQQSSQLLESPKTVAERAVIHRDQLFPLRERATHAAMVPATVIGASSFIVLDAKYPKPDDVLLMGLLAFILIFPALLATVVGLSVYIPMKYLIKHKYQRYIDETPVQTTIAIRTQLQGNTLTTRLKTPWASDTLETQTIDIADEQSLKTVAQCRVRDEYCEKLLNGWIDGTIKQLPGDEAVQQRQQLAQAHTDIAQQLLGRTQPLSLSKPLSDITESGV